MSELPFKFDEIGYWSELKLEIVEKYGAAYTQTFANFPRLKKYYIDGFSGAGVHISKTTGTAHRRQPHPSSEGDASLRRLLFHRSQRR